MRVDDLGLDERIPQILASQGITELYPPQQESIGPALEGKNLVLAIPTASGKSLVAYLAILKSVLNGGKALYIVPLRALAREKYDDLRSFEPLGLRVALAMGDYDTDDPTLQRYDVIVATSEKADSLLRHRSHWLGQLTVVIADEVHLINDAGRGPTLEVTLAKLRQVNPKAQIIALSATIANSYEIAEWLEGVHIKSEWRPVPLKAGVYAAGRIFWSDQTTKYLLESGDDLDVLVKDSLKDGGQCLIFVNTRQSTETVARKLMKPVGLFIHPDEAETLSSIAEEEARVQEESTSVGNRLARCVRSGTAFHHAGLTNEQRKLVEENFKKGVIKVIVASPTLAFGVNLPARRVIIRDTRRYDSNYGYTPLSVMEIKQMCGRAGRPRYDPYGEAILVARHEEDAEFLQEAYLDAEPEAVESKLGTEPALRVHILAVIATEHVRTEAELFRFMERTFYAHQGDVQDIEGRIQAVLTFLEAEGFIRRGEFLNPTLFGRRTSDLYIDPLSAVELRKALTAKEEGSAFSYLHAICATPDMSKLYLRQRDYEWVEAKLSAEDLFVKGEDYDFLLAEVKTAALLEAWIDEATADDIVKKFKVGPGDIRRMVDTAQWLLYSMHELARLFNRDRMKPLAQLMPRVRYGIREDALDLINLRGIGRVRARVLLERGMRTREDLRNVTVEWLSRLPSFGLALAQSLLGQLGVAGSRAPVEESPKKEGQFAIHDFE